MKEGMRTKKVTFHSFRKQKFIFFSISQVLYSFLFIGYVGYFIAAMVKCYVDKVRDPTPLITVTMVVLGLFIIWFVRKRFEEDIYSNFISPVKDCFTSKEKLQLAVKM